MSDKYRPSRFEGVSRVDSVTWNPHKLLGTLLQCSTFHCKEKVKVTSLEQLPSHLNKLDPCGQLQNFTLISNLVLLSLY